MCVHRRDPQRDRALIASSHSRSFLPRALACICILLDLSSGRTEERAEDLARVQYAYAQLDAVRHTSVRFASLESVHVCRVPDKPSFSLYMSADVKSYST